jgi:hypothetical protein
MNTKTLDRDIPQPQQSVGQAIEGDKMNGLPLDIENSKTHNTMLCVDIPARDIYSEDSGSKATPMERMHSKENTSDGKSQMYELHMTQSQTNTMRTKKLKTERNEPATRKRSKTRLKTTHK